jgi:hypothetical protein
MKNRAGGTGPPTRELRDATNYAGRYTATQST